MSQVIIARRRLGSVGDSSAPPSDSSEGTPSDTCEINPDWTTSSLDDHHHHSNNHSHHTHNPMMKQQKQQQQQQQQEYLQSSSASSATMKRLFINNSSPLDADIDADADAVDDSVVDNLSLLENASTTTTVTATILSDLERSQIESFFSGLGTEIYVSSSLANLYESVGKDDWRLVYTGIPVLLHDKGSARSRTIPRVTFCLAERGSCFALWKDAIDNLSDYKVAGPSFHTMCLSSDHRQIIGFSFDSNDSAHDLWKMIEKLTSNPENIALSVPGRKKIKQKRQKSVPLPPKSQISHPCQFLHVTSVTTDDSDKYYSLRAFTSKSFGHSNKHRAH